METRRWINQSQPQTLYVAVFLMYMTAAFALLFGLNDAPYGAFFFKITSDGGFTDTLVNLTRVAVIAGSVAAGYGISNERKWGYKLGVAVAALPLVALVFVCIAYQVSPLDFPVITTMFNVAEFALLVHPQSREYERIWFK